MRNFMPYKGDTTLEFPQDDMRNTLIVFGDNMRGKTSLLNALRWGFYGKALGRHLRLLPLHQMPNRESAKDGDWNMDVRIEFEANGVEYDLRRSAKKRNLIATPTSDSDFEILLFLKKDGVAILSDKIEAEINQFAPEQTSRFFLFDGELLQEYEELLIEDSMQGRKIKDAIEQALGVPALINGRDDLSIIIRNAQKLQAKEASNIEGIESLSQNYDRNVVKLASYDNDLKSTQLILNDIIIKRQNLDDELEKNDVVFQQKVELDFNKNRIKEIVKEIEQKNITRLKLIGMAWSDLLAPKLIVERNKLTDEQERLINLLGERSRIELQIKQLEQYLNSTVCPTCNQTTIIKNRESKELQLHQLRIDLKSYDNNSSNLADVAIKLQGISKIIEQGVGQRLSDIVKDIAHLDLELMRAENKNVVIRDSINGFDTNDIIRQRKYRDTLLKEEQQIIIKIDTIKSTINKVEAENRILSNRISEVTDRQAGVKGTLLLKLSEQLHNVFVLGIEKLREELRYTVQNKASEAFLKMSTQQQYSGLTINKNYGLTIQDQNGNDVINRAAGAEQIVALSLIAGLIQAGSANAPIVMDTPFGRLDRNHRKNILSYLPTSVGQLVLFVHDGEIRDDNDLDVIANKIGGRYMIKEITPTHSQLVPYEQY